MRAVSPALVDLFEFSFMKSFDVILFSCRKSHRAPSTSKWILLMTHRRLKPRVLDWLALVRHTWSKHKTTHLYKDLKVQFLFSSNYSCTFMHLLDLAFSFHSLSTHAGVESGKPTHFTVLTKGAGKAPLDVTFSSAVKDFDIIDNYDYSHTVKYTPAQQVC